jgi:hypothetical protein
MAFPINPNDGDIYTNANGTTYMYVAATTRWVIVNGSAVNDTAFAASWNGDTTHSPSKNTIYDMVDTTTTLGTSDVKVPSQNAVKTYADNLVDIDFGFFFRSSDQNVNSASNDIIQFNSTSEAQNMTLTTGASALVTVTNAGVYLIQARILYSNTDTDGNRQCEVYINGSRLMVEQRDADLTGHTPVQLNVVSRIAASGTVQIKGYQNSGSTLVYKGDANGNYTWLRLTRIGT